MSFAPPLEGTSITAIFRLFAVGGSGHFYLVLRMHPPVAAQAELPVKYRYSLEVSRGLLWDEAEPALWVTSEIDLPAYQRGGEEDHFLGLFDEQGHHSLGRSAEWGSLLSFTKKALELVTDRLDVDVRMLRPAMALDTNQGPRSPDPEVVHTSIELQARL